MPEIELDNDIDITLTYFKTLDAGVNSGTKEIKLSKLYSILHEPSISSHKYHSGLIVSGRVDGTRNRVNTKYKSLILIDIDNLPAYFDLYDEVGAVWKYAFAVYTSFSHTELEPRYRLIIPIDRTVENEEYQALVRYILEILDLPELNGEPASDEKANFDISRAFALPVVQSEEHKKDYIFDYEDAEIFSVTDEVLQNALERIQQAKPPKDGRPFMLKVAKPVTDYVGILQGVEKGERNNSMMSLVGHLFHSGLHALEIYEVVSMWNESRVNPPLPDKAIVTAINNIINAELERRGMQ
ncbi:primase alpha helix C-terminal domain-containing protein [Salinicoccus roseus]|uniref:primase alpha helix C-terminal domain-containing protein n=1 Tax=Salinicoccus roseus TaxID=45670 RepID=UPI003DA19114